MIIIVTPTVKLFALAETNMAATCSSCGVETTVISNIQTLVLDSRLPSSS